MYRQYGRLQPGSELTAEFQERYPQLLVEVMPAALVKAGIALEDLR